MGEVLGNSTFFGLFISFVSFGIGMVLKQKLKWSIVNPLLISVIIVICTLLLLDIDYAKYEKTTTSLSYLLTPATVCLAVPLYQQIQVLRDNMLAVLLGITSGVFASVGSIFIMSKAFGLSYGECMTLLPKSITTAIGMGVSEELGGIVTITLASIIITGMIGNSTAEIACKLFRIKSPISKGLAIGTASHAVGTAKAVEMGQIEGAMSSLAIAVAGLITVAIAPFFAMIY
ncbi:MAG: LrgB family protein [Anaerovoracaceae bacterium]